MCNEMFPSKSEINILTEFCFQLSEAEYASGVNIFF